MPLAAGDAVGPADLDAVGEVPRRFFSSDARAAARIGFGLTLIAGTIALIGSVLAHRHAGAALTLLIVWISAFTVGGLVMLFADGARSSALDHKHVASFVLPSVGIALVLPITLHALFMGIAGWLDSFDEWVRICLLITGPAHVVFAIMVGRRAHALANGGEVVSVARIFATTIIVSAIPFALLALIPPLLVAVTGLAILPLLDAMPAWIQRELAVATVPTAIAHYKETAHV